MQSVVVRILSCTVLSVSLAATLAQAQSPATLKDAYKGKFLIGTAINAAETLGTDTVGDKLLFEQFNSIVPENALKWESVHPEPNRYDFALADKFVELGRAHGMYIVGHNLVWHWQTPDWVFRNETGNLLTRQALLDRLHRHIATVVGRYKGKIDCWDVVTEALEEDGSLRQSMWMKIVGPDYIEKAFEYAHEADPAALLNYNDYNLENEAKRRGAVALIKKLKAEGIPIGSVGIQAHGNLDGPTAAQMDAAITELSALGVKVAITELDLTVLPTPGNQPTADVNLKVAEDPRLNPYVHGLPKEIDQKLAARYGELFRVFTNHAGAVNRVTLWGISDADSWLNDWPAKGRTNYPLLFDREHKPKAAFAAVIGAARTK